MAVMFFRRAFLTFISFWLDVGKSVVEGLQEGGLLFFFFCWPLAKEENTDTLAQTLHTSTMIGLNNEHKLKETIYVIQLVISLQAAAAPAIATRTDRWTVCT